MASFVPPIVEPLSELALRQNVFHECVGHFRDGLAQRILLDLELERATRKFLENATEHFQSCVKQDEQTCLAHNSFAKEVSSRLNEFEAPQKIEYNISYCFIQVFNVLLAMMHPKGEIAQVSDVGADQSIAGAKDLLAKFEAHLKYLQRQNYDAQGVIDSWDSPLAIKEEEYKRAQMNATVWTKLKTLPIGSVKQFETVYNLLKLLQSVYNSFESRGMSIYRTKYMTSAIRSMARLIRGELEVPRDFAETDSAVQALVTIFDDLVDVWKNDSLKTRGVISRLQGHVEQMESNGELNARHLAVNSFIFMLSSLKMFQPRSQNNTNELMRGLKVLRVRLKRTECFTDVGYQLIELWQHIEKSGAVKLQSAYFVLDHDDKKGDKDDRKISGALCYFIAESDEQAMLFQKIHVAWMLPKAERERFFEQWCPELAALQQDDLDDVEESERRLARQRLLRKHMSLEALKEEEALQKDEELQEFLCASDAWRGPAGKFGNEWLESFVGGTWSMAEEQKRDPGKKEEDIWLQKIMEAQKKRFHIFFALQEDKGTNKKQSSNHQGAKRTSKWKNKKSSDHQKPKRTRKGKKKKPSPHKRAWKKFHSPKKAAWSFGGGS